MTNPEPYIIRLAGLTQDKVTEGTQNAIRNLGLELTRALEADEHDRRAAISVLAAHAVIEGIRFAWSELVAQLLEAGIHVTGTLDIDTVSRGGQDE